MVKLYRYIFKIVNILENSFVYLFFSSYFSNRETPDIRDVGFISRDNRFMFFEDQATQQFNPNLISQDAKIFKDHKIKLCTIDGRFALRKYYANRLSLVNELLSYKLLKDLKFIPEVLYIDKSNRTVYYSLIKGITIDDSTFWQKNMKSVEDVKQLEIQLLRMLNRAHDFNLLINDVRLKNFIIQGQDIFLFDFEDSSKLYFRNKIASALLKTDLKRLYNETDRFKKEYKIYK